MLSLLDFYREPHDSDRTFYQPALCGFPLLALLPKGRQLCLRLREQAPRLLELSSQLSGLRTSSSTLTLSSTLEGAHGCENCRRSQLLVSVRNWTCYNVTAVHGH